MSAVAQGPLGRAELAEISRALRERIRLGVSLEVWTRPADEIVSPERDDGRHAAETLALMRQLKTLHPALTLTPYDLEKHASRAEAAGIEHSPTVVLRAGGRSVQIVGMLYGPLFPPMLDIMGFLSMGQTPLAPETRAVLGALPADVQVEAFLTPFDPFSVQMLPLLGAFAVDGKRVRLRIVEASQFPVLAGQRLVTEVPLLVMNGQRYAGYWTEQELAEQIRGLAEGSDEKVIRARVVSAEYVSEDEARRIAMEQVQAEQAQQTQAGGGSETSSGLYIPGRD
ncbi:MAG: hypothetical protein M0R73_11275 [Dehalococcoidia bacterium]|nr:hypothetical protein [Dehalococcoidia bacterium]